MYDVIIIGGGVVGGCIFRELTKYNLDVILLEKENDVCEGASKANSAIVHSGYDPEPNTLMAKLNVRGNFLFEDMCKDLNVPFKRDGSLIIGFDDNDKKVIDLLYKRGVENGVPDLRILSKDEIYKKEENLAEGVLCALYAPTGGIVGTYEFTIALIENATDNGGALRRSFEVVSISKSKDNFTVYSEDGSSVEGKIIINAAGIYADIIHNMVCEPSYKLRPVKGQYFVLDKQNVVNTTVFQCPTELGKGILVTPTVHGNVLVGPDATDETSRDNVGTTQASFDHIKEVSSKTTHINFGTNIRNFSGLRAHSDRADFIIEEDKKVSNFIDVAGIKSPGLSSSPAIAEMVVDMISKKLPLTKNKRFNGVRRKTSVMNLSLEEKNLLIKKDDKYGRVICRCENITEGEIVESIINSCGAVSLEGVKKRCRPGAGRCQGGFCGPRILEILARELGSKEEDVLFSKVGSNILMKEE